MPDLTSLCSLSSGYHSCGGEEAVCPNAFHPLRKELQQFLFSSRCSKDSEKSEASHICSTIFLTLTELFVFFTVCSVSREASVVLCCVSAVRSFQWTRHIMQRGGACRAADLPSAYALFVSISTKGRNEFKECAYLPVLFDTNIGYSWFKTGMFKSVTSGETGAHTQITPLQWKINLSQLASVLVQ